jgi:hypothetical protein
MFLRLNQNDSVVVQCIAFGLVIALNQGERRVQDFSNDKLLIPRTEAIHWITCACVRFQETQRRLMLTISYNLARVAHIKNTILLLIEPCSNFLCYEVSIGINNLRSCDRCHYTPLPLNRRGTTHRVAAVILEPS